HDPGPQQGVWNYVFIEEAWRGMFSIGVIPSILFLLGLVFIPESPRWLFQRSRKEEARVILTKIGGAASAERDIAAIGETLDQESGSYRELFAPGMRKAMLIGILLPLFSQFSGINAVIYYGPRILNDAGINLSNALFSQIILGTALMLFTLIA